MQKIQTISGSVTLGSTSKRIYSFGQTTTLTNYASHTDVINTKIAAFLQSCGVDAVYEKRSDADATNKWLWIEGVPLLLIRSSSSSGSLVLRYPNSTDNIWSGSVNLFDSYNGTTYNFRLGFAGQAKRAWVLRIGLYGATAFAATYHLVFYHGRSVVDNSPVVLFGEKPYGVANGCYAGNLHIAKFAEGSYVKKVADLETATDFPTQFWGGRVAAWKAQHNGDYPLIPIHCGPYIIPGVYMFFGGMGLPQGSLYTSDSQTEATIGGRKFLITSIDSTTTDYLNLGLIETT